MFRVKDSVRLRYGRNLWAAIDSRWTIFQDLELVVRRRPLPMWLLLRQDHFLQAVGDESQRSLQPRRSNGIL